MAKISNPVLFSDHFKVDASELMSLGVLDPFINADTQLFIDPLLLEGSMHDEMKEAAALYQKYFENIIMLLMASKAKGDVPWRNAAKLFRTKEISGTCLGYGSETTRGSGFGPKLTEAIMLTASQIVSLGVDNPDLFLLMGLFEGDVGPDRISDQATNAILPALLSFNQRILGSLTVPTREFTVRGLKANLIENPFDPKRPIIFVPLDVIRDLPTVNNWRDISSISAENDDIRQRINSKIAEYWKIKSVEEKNRARDVAQKDKELIDALLTCVEIANKEAYDFNADMLGVGVMRKFLSIASSFPCAMPHVHPTTDEEIMAVVDKIIVQYKWLIETCRHSEDLWHKDVRRHEATAQRMFFATATSYCRANNIDLIAEANNGAGPVDFKLSHGADAKVLVEIKLSTGKVLSGYKKQLEIYEDVEQTKSSYLLVVDVGEMGGKLNDIQTLRNEKVRDGLPAPKIVVVDGMRRPSASKA